MLHFTSENKATKEDLDRINSNVPLEYRDFLLRQNGGQPEPLPSFKRKLDDEEQEEAIEYFYNVEEINEAIENLSEEDEFEGLLPIAATLGSAVVCIGNTPENEGKVYILDWDFGVTLQAESFTSFVKQLYI